MSLILDALNRADQERSDGDKAPSIRTVHTPMQQAEKPVKRWLVEGLVLLLALLVIAYLLFANRAPTNTSTLPPVAAVTSTEPKAAPAPVPTSEPTSRPLAPTAQQAAVEQSSQALDTMAKAAAKPLAALAAPQKTIHTKPAVKKITAKSDPAIASLYQQQSVQQSTVKPDAKPTAKAPTPTINNRVTQTTAKEPENITATILAQLPYLAELPTRFQNTVPSINYSIHVYSETEDSGFVNLNGSMRRVGNEVEPGLRVIAILRDSVVLDYRGTQFRLIALNSWVNFK